MEEWKKKVSECCWSSSSSSSKLTWFVVPFLMAFGVIMLLGSRSSTLLFLTRWKGGDDYNIYEKSNTAGVQFPVSLSSLVTLFSVTSNASIHVQWKLVHNNP